MKRNIFFRICLASVLAITFILAGCPEAGQTTVERAWAPEVFPIDVPKNLEVSSGNADLTVTWDAVINAEKYEVSWGTGGAWTGQTEVTATDYIITGLTNLTVYNVRVRAGNGDRWSEWSGTETGKPSNIPAPANLTVVVRDSGLTVSWTAVPNATQYKLQYAADNFNIEDDRFGLEDPATVVTVTGTTHNLTGLTNNVLYRVRVRAVINENEGGWSGTRRVIPAGRPGQPVLTVNFIHTERRAMVNWAPVEGATRYRYAYSSDPLDEFGPTELSAWTETTDNRAVLTDFVFGETYYVWVMAGNLGTAWSNPGKESFLTSVVYGAPTVAPTIRAGHAGWEVGGPATDDQLNYFIPAAFSESGQNEFGGPLGHYISHPRSNSAFPDGKDKSLLSSVYMLTWHPVDGAISYDVYIGTTTTMPATPVGNTTQTSYFHRGIAAAGVRHYWWVQAANEKGKGPVSAIYSNTSGELNMPNNQTIQLVGGGTGWVERADFPQELKATVVGEGEVRLQWHRSDRAAWYEVYYHTSKLTFGTGTAENIDRGRLAQNDAFSAGLLGGLANTYLSDTTNNHIGTDYMVPYNRFGPLQNVATPWNGKEDKPGEIFEIHKIHALEATITGLDPAQDYWFWVRSVNHNGDANMARWPPPRNNANIINVGIYPTLQEVGLPAPTNVLAVPDGVGAITVTWDPVSGVTGYEVFYSLHPLTPNFAHQSGVPPATRVNVIGEVTSFTTISGLQQNAEYYIWVLAYKRPGDVQTAAPITRSAFSERQRALVGFEESSFVDKGVDKLGIWREPLKNLVYIDVNEYDPRVAKDYVLASGERFFDVVVLHNAGGLRVRDCSLETLRPNHRCNQKGPHIHYNGNLQHILNNRDKYIKPLQDVGIKVTLGLRGDGDPFAFHSLGRWPFEATYPWFDEDRDVGDEATPNPGIAYHASWWTGDPEEYPFGAATREAFLTHLAAEITKFGLDGFDINDENYATGGTGGLLVAFGSHNGIATANAERNRLIAQNYAEFIYQMRQKLGPNAIISMLQRGGTTLLSTAEAVFVTDDPANPVDVNPNVWTYVTMAGRGTYDGTAGATWAGLPRSKYSPFAINLTGTMPTGYTTYTNANASGDGFFGWVGFLNLRMISEVGNISDSANNLSRYAVNLYGQGLRYIGPGYVRDWNRW